MPSIVKKLTTSSSVYKEEIPDLDSEEKRVYHLASLMSMGKWEANYIQRQRYSEAWEVSDNKVRDYASKAFFLIKLDPEQREQLRHHFYETLMDISREARTKINHTTGLADYKAAIEAIKTAAQFAGIDTTPQKNPEVSIGAASIVVEIKQPDKPVIDTDGATVVEPTKLFE